MKTGYLQFYPELGNPEKNIERIKYLLKDKEFDLIVLPELANTGYLFNTKDELIKLSEKAGEGLFYNSLLEIAKTKNAYITAGFAESDGENIYNSAMLVSPKGIEGIYRKIHLFDEEKKLFTPGNYGFKTFNINIKNETVKTGIMICFDWAFPEAARTLALQGSQIICHPSNLVMPYCQKAMFARAVENRVFIITANRYGTDKNGENKISFTGGSVMLDCSGNYIAIAPVDKDEVFITGINPEDAKNKFINTNNNLFEDRKKEFYYN